MDSVSIMRRYDPFGIITIAPTIRRPGIAVVGDAFATTCPATGTGRFLRGWSYRACTATRLWCCDASLLVRLKQGRRPKLLCRFHRRDLQLSPPRLFVAMAVQIIMVLAAQRHRELITDLAS
jgi:hypothetical protein